MMRAILIAAACMLLSASVPAGAAANYTCDGLACECEPDDAGGSSSQDCKNLGASGKCSGHITCWCGWLVCTCGCWRTLGATMQSGPYSPVRGGTRQLAPGLLEGEGGTLSPQGPASTGTPTPTPPRAPAGRIN